jgi:hypothetical protein
MGKRGHSEEEILRVLREAESGDTVVEVCRKRCGHSERTSPISPSPNSMP